MYGIQFGTTKHVVMLKKLEVRKQYYLQMAVGNTEQKLTHTIIAVASPLLESDY